MKKLLFAMGICLISISIRPKKVKAPICQCTAETYPGTNIPILPGDLLFSPIGKKESRYVGHVGIVTQTYEVIHSIPAGLARDSVGRYFENFRGISLYSPIEQQLGRKASEYLERLYVEHPRALYRMLTPLGTMDHEQYCTKIVWQSYYFGAGINLGNLSEKSKLVHPLRLKDRRFLRRKRKFS